ncbi:hypothetical protein Shyhy02_66210 [Streptomyces hygroscopicus subsp. hygroscopicus]|nr:hypothetical protein Shyhy02_66210 [Streptomyces hygroscopicus subsp. hygroscopicus]
MDFEIRKDRSGGGGRRLTREREVYLQLMSQCYGNRKAAGSSGPTGGLAVGIRALPRRSGGVRR